MKKLHLLISILAFLSIVACAKKPNKELIIGTWEITDGNYDGITKMFFGFDKRFKIYNGSRELEKNDISEYRLIDEKDFSDYPKFNKENENGSIIAFVVIEKDGELYEGTNMLGPFEIISLSKDELCIKDLHEKLFDNNPGSKQNLVKFKRIKGTN